MQQTDKYKLNLIENSDTFSPDPLNDNMEKVEAAFQAASDARAAESAARKDADTALSKRVTALELRKLAYGSYTGAGHGTVVTIKTGFRPKVVLVCDAMVNCGISVSALAAEGVPTRGTHDTTPLISIIDGGFSINSYPGISSYPTDINKPNMVYNYIAFC